MFGQVPTVAYRKHHPADDHQNAECDHEGFGLEPKCQVVHHPSRARALWPREHWQEEETGDDECQEDARDDTAEERRGTVVVNQGGDACTEKDAQNIYTYLPTLIQISCG